MAGVKLVSDLKLKKRYPDHAISLVIDTDDGRKKRAKRTFVQPFIGQINNMAELPVRVYYISWRNELDERK